MTGACASPAAPTARSLLEWIDAFASEVLHERRPMTRTRLERSVDARLADGDAGFALWEVDGRGRLARGLRRPTPNGIRIGPVYTPPEHRGRGYGERA